jgi:hypothetical protein
MRPRRKCRQKLRPRRSDHAARKVAAAPFTLIKEDSMPSSVSRRSEWIGRAMLGIASAGTTADRMLILGSLYDVAAADGAIIGAKEMAEKLAPGCTQGAIRLAPEQDPPA